jgi:hypothetical protein
MKNKKIINGLIINGLILLALSTTAIAGATIKSTVCSVIDDVADAILAIGGTLVVIMFVYGGTKYTFSADDPGGRKSGKMTCIHAMIGGILIMLADIIVGPSGVISLAGCP